MNKRKIILLSACGVLLCIYILQIVFSNRKPVKSLVLETDPDKIEIASKSTDIILAKENGKWVVGAKKYQASDTKTAEILNDIKSIQVLDAVARTAGDESIARYELTPEKVITVTASKAGKILRTIAVGKASSTGSQSYITIDNGKNIYLAAGNLHDTFSGTENDIRSKIAYDIGKDSITKIAVTAEGKSWAVEKKGNPAAWAASAGTDTVDAEKTATWAGSLVSLNVSDWLNDDFVLPETSEAVVTITADTKTITLTLYKTGTGNDVKYYGTCNETPYKFSISSYAAVKYIKNLDDLKK
jgi:hypothetical protein